MTDEQLGYRRINTSVCLDPNEFIIRDNKLEWNPHFRERLLDYQNEFKDLFQDRVINKIGHTGWAVQFTQVSQEDIFWFVDIYINIPDYYFPIIAIVKEHMPKEFRLQFYNRGDISTYTRSQK